MKKDEKDGMKKPPQKPGTAQGGALWDPHPAFCSKCSTPAGTPLGGLGKCGITGSAGFGWGLHPWGSQRAPCSTDVLPPLASPQPLALGDSPCCSR